MITRHDVTQRQPDEPPRSHPPCDPKRPQQPTTATPGIAAAASTDPRRPRPSLLAPGIAAAQKTPERPTMSRYRPNRARPRELPQGVPPRPGCAAPAWAPPLRLSAATAG